MSLEQLQTGSSKREDSKEHIIAGELYEEACMNLTCNLKLDCYNNL